MSLAPDIIVAFAFSLMPDGAPGSYNERLAEQLQTKLQSYQGHFPYVGVQWEIADALAEADPALFQSLQRSQTLIVVEPPKFAADDINETKFKNWLAETSSDSARSLQRWLATAKSNSITEKLNKLLDEPKLYADFAQVELTNLERPKLGGLFSEHRDLPRSPSYPLGLRPFQRKRINRLIIESLVENAEIIQRGRYLSTTGVIDFVLDQLAKHSPTQFQKVSIIAHPLHAPRCIEQTKQALFARQSSVNVSAVGLDQNFPWDEATAQIWCRSLSNWSKYEDRVQKLMAQR